MKDRPNVASPRTTTVYLARHAETVWNVERRFQGHRDSPLSERGLEQARRLAQRLAETPLAAVYASDLGRASSTAELVARPHGLDVRTHPGLREIDTGEWTGRQRTDVLAVPRWAAMFETYRARPWEHRMPGGETVAEVQARGLAAFREIAVSHPDQSVAVISHHLVVEAILAAVLGLALDRLWLPQRGGNCFVSVVEARGDDLAPIVIYDGTHIGELAGLDGAKSAEKGIG